jgi:glycosyltransferase involved in cell wall biosynthesis
VRIVSLNMSDSQGGAAKAAYRLHLGLKNLKKLKVVSNWFVERKTVNDAYVDELSGTIFPGSVLRNLRPYLDNLPVEFYRNRRRTYWDVGWLPRRVSSRIKPLRPDIVHLHWICHGFVPIAEIRRFIWPIVWTFHDSWAFTGGCHVPFDCRLFEDECGCCPQLNSCCSRDLSRWTWKWKQRQWRSMKFHIVCPSQWLADQTRRSSLFQDSSVTVIPNGLDMEIYHPVPQSQAREKLGIQGRNILILLVAMNLSQDINKGVDLLTAAVRGLKNQPWAHHAEIMIAGTDSPQNPPDLGLPVRYLGVIKNDATLASLYSAADVLVFPSRQENLPNTIMEAMACGLPAVAFRVGGTPELIDHGITGYLADPYDVSDLASGISWVLSDSARRRNLREESRRSAVEKYRIERVVEAYLSLYERILKNSLRTIY